MILHDLIVKLYGQAVYSALAYIFGLYPIWLPIILAAVFIELWMRWRRSKFVLDQGSVLLEIKIPAEITKSPAAMEVFITSLYQTGSASYGETYIDGKVRPWYSFELVSFEGAVHFYIWAHKKFKSIIEAQIYAQYPEVEVAEAEDYARNFVLDQKKHVVWASYFVLSKASPIPIKTYIDYGLDKNEDEELKIDPMTAALEYLGSIGKGEQVWIQYLFQAHKKEGLKEGRLRKVDDWKKLVEGEIKNIHEKLVSKEITAPRRPTKGEQDTIAAMERHVGKYPFDAMVRGYYIADKEHFNAIRITGLIASLRQYSTPNLNSFRLGGNTDFEDNFKDFYRYLFKNHGQRLRRRWERKMMNAFKLRSFFQPPYKHQWKQSPFILTTEELATIFHFPGQVAATPGLPRIPSKKGQAPTDLPI